MAWGARVTTSSSRSSNPFEKKPQAADIRTMVDQMYECLGLGRFFSCGRTGKGAGAVAAPAEIGSAPLMSHEVQWFLPNRKTSKTQNLRRRTLRARASACIALHEGRRS